MHSRFAIMLSIGLVVVPLAASAQMTGDTDLQQEVDVTERRLNETMPRPGVRILRKRAVGERDRRAELRQKKQNYLGGMVERVGELQFHRNERRLKRISDDDRN